MTYLLLKWLHIVAAIVLVGTHITYGFWIVRGSRHPEALPFTLRNVSWLDRHLVMPAYVVLVGAGFTMVGKMRIPLTTPWLLAALVLFLVLVLAHALWYAPLIRRMIRLLDSEGSASPSYVTSAHHEARLGIALVLVMIAIAFLMVVKPQLWG